MKLAKPKLPFFPIATLLKYAPHQMWIEFTLPVFKMGRIRVGLQFIPFVNPTRFRPTRPDRHPECKR